MMLGAAVEAQTTWATYTVVGFGGASGFGWVSPEMSTDFQPMPVSARLLARGTHWAMEP